MLHSLEDWSLEDNLPCWAYSLAICSIRLYAMVSSTGSPSSSTLRGGSCCGAWLPPLLVDDDDGGDPGRVKSVSWDVKPESCDDTLERRQAGLPGCDMLRCRW